MNSPRKQREFRFLIDRIMAPSGPMILWKINQRCNFRCEYCFLKKSELSKEHPESGSYSPDHISRCFDRTSKTWTILMTGGEPFLYPDFIELCQNLTVNHSIAINSNLSTSNVQRFAEKIDPERVALVNAAYHRSELERTDRKEAFLKNLLCLQDKGFPVCVECVVFPPLIKHIEKDLNLLDSAGVRFVNLKVFRGVFQSKVYPRAYCQEERAFFRNNCLDEREIDYIENPFSYFGQFCRTGTNFFFMDFGGKLRRCPGSAKSYGNLFRGNLNMDGQPRPCPFPRCFSPWIGRTHILNRTVDPFLTAKEILREGAPFVLKKGRMSSVFRSLRNSLLEG